MVDFGEVDEVVEVEVVEVKAEVAPGVRLECAWSVLGVRPENAWSAPRERLECAWRGPGVRLECAWRSPGVCLEWAWSALKPVSLHPRGCEILDRKTAQLFRRPPAEIMTRLAKKKRPSRTKYAADLVPRSGGQNVPSPSFFE